MLSRGLKGCAKCVWPPSGAEKASVAALARVTTGTAAVKAKAKPKVKAGSKAAAKKAVAVRVAKEKATARRPAAA